LDPFAEMSDETEGLGRTRTLANAITAAPARQSP
jgi:hypothetical protein